MGARCCVEAVRRVARNCWKTFDKAKDLGDHFTGNPNNTGWTSTGGGEFFLKKFALLYRPRLLPKMSGEFR